MGGNLEGPWSGSTTSGAPHKEGKQAVKVTRLSCYRFRSKVRLWLSPIAYNLGNLWGRLVKGRGDGKVSLASVGKKGVPRFERPPGT
jgi:hypothetical protein